MDFDKKDAGNGKVAKTELQKVDFFKWPLLKIASLHTSSYRQATATG
jgi:hypothetical protein